jgi:antitoxin component HigA of HigAB toxin-antitoxin module
LFAYPTEEGKPIDPAVLQLRETMLMDGFIGGLKSNLRERMSFKDYKNLNDLVKATEKCAAVLSEAKLEKRSVEFVNAISADANAHELRETKNEISELRSVMEQMAQKLADTTLVGNNKKAVNVVSTTQATQVTESKREIEELKNLLRASNKNYSDMMRQSYGPATHTYEETPPSYDWTTGQQYEPQAPPPPIPEESDQLQKICYFCGETGHTQITCYKKRQTEYAESPICCLCREMGHKSHQCPNNNHTLEFPYTHVQQTM